MNTYVVNSCQVYVSVINHWCCNIVFGSKVAIERFQGSLTNSGLRIGAMAIYASFVECFEKLRHSLV